MARANVAVKPRLRTNPAPASVADGPPRALLLGCCREVWSTAEGIRADRECRANYMRALQWWRAEVDPTFSPGISGNRWSVHSFGCLDRHSGSYADIDAVIEERFGAAGCTLDDLPELRGEARALLERIGHRPSPDPNQNGA